MKISWKKNVEHKQLNDEQKVASMIIITMKTKIKLKRNLMKVLGDLWNTIKNLKLKK